LSRNIGSSVGISVVNSLLTTNTQVNHAAIAQRTSRHVNRAFEDPHDHPILESVDRRRSRRARCSRHPQAQIIAYIDDYKLLMIATLAVIPLLVVFKKAAGGGGPDHTITVE